MNFVYLEPMSQAFTICSNEGQGKEQTLRGTDGVGIVAVEDTVNQYNGIRSRSICRAQDGTEVAGFFNSFQHKKEWVLWQIKRGEGMALLLADGDDAIRTFAKTGFFEGFWADADGCGAFSRTAFTDEFGMCFGGKMLGAIEKLLNVVTCREGVREFAKTFY